LAGEVEADAKGDGDDQGAEKIHAHTFRFDAGGIALRCAAS
jgi:hypothetical protein